MNKFQEKYITLSKNIIKIMAMLLVLRHSMSLKKSWKIVMTFAQSMF